MNKQKSKSGSAHLIIIIVLVIVLLGALGFVYWSNFVQTKTSKVATVNTTVDPTAGWSTYNGVISTGSTFSIKYPNGWTLEDDTSKEASTAGPSFIVLRKDNSQQSGDNFIQILKYYADSSSWLSNATSSNAVVTDATIAGFSVKKSVFPATQQNRAGIGYFLLHNGTNYDIDILFTSSSDSFGEKILNTIKFS